MESAKMESATARLQPPFPALDEEIILVSEIDEESQCSEEDTESSVSDAVLSMTPGNVGGENQRENNVSERPSTITGSSIEGLSLDVLAWLMSYLSLTEINAVSLASRRLSRAGRSNALWKLKFENRWKMDDVFQAMALSGQNWYLAYQQAYRNPNDLWIFHWNCTYPQDGLVPGRCCIYDMPKYTTSSTEKGTGATEPPKHKPLALEDLCPPCRFFPQHPLKNAERLFSEEHNNTSSSNRRPPKTNTEAIAQATDHMIRDFRKQHPNTKSSKKEPTYSASRAKGAFSRASTFHRTLDTRQYRAASPRHESTSTHLSPLKDLLFFNVTEEPLSTQRGDAELEHLRQERNLQQQWERSIHSRDRRNTQEFRKPAHETAHHTWHQAVATNPDFVRPMVFRIFVQRPDCFTVFPSEGFLEAGQSLVITFGVRPLGSLVATAFDTINAQRDDGVEDWVQQVHNEEGPLPFSPFVIRYKYSSVVPCVPARGYLSPHQPQPRHQEDPVVSNINEPDHDGNTSSSYPAVADICWQQKQTMDFHWSGGDPNAAAVEPHEVRSIFLSAHVNAHYPFAQFCGDTLAPFDLFVDPKDKQQSAMPSHQQPDHSPMLYFAAPQLFEFYPQTVFPHLQRVQLETEVSHAGHAFRNHRKKCPRCRRTSWGPRLEEMGQAFVKTQLESWLWQQRQTALLQNCITIIRAVYAYLEQEEESESNELAPLLEEASKETDKVAPQPVDDIEPMPRAVRCQQILFVALRMLLRYRSAPYVRRRLRAVLTKFEMAADGLYGLYSMQLARKPIKDNETRPWRQAGNYRYLKSTDSIFDPAQTLTNGHEHWEEYVKDEPESMNPFCRLIQTPGKYCLGLQEDPNHLEEFVSSNQGNNPRQKGCATDMFMDDPIRSLQCALVTLSNPRSVVVHGVFDRVNYPGKVVRRPRFSQWSRESIDEANSIKVPLTGRANYYLLQDALALDYLVHSSAKSVYRTISMRRYLRNIPPMGMGRFPLSIDDNTDPGANAADTKAEEVSPNLVGHDSENSPATRGDNDDIEVKILAASRLVDLPVPIFLEEAPNLPSISRGTVSTPSPPTLQSEIFLRPNPRPGGLGIGNANNMNFVEMPGVRPPLLRGPGPRLLNMMWAISAQLGWSVDDPSQTAASVVVNRQLLIGLQWLSLTLMAAPVFCSLCARGLQWIPCKPVNYRLDELPYQLTSELRFLSEPECGAVAVLFFIFWLSLGRWTERWAGRDFMRAMLEHVTPQTPETSSFKDRLVLRYKRRWDSICPLFLQRLTYAPDWNRRAIGDLMKHVAFWKSQDFREHSSIFQATAGRGIMFCSDQWKQVDVNDESSRKLLLAAVAAIGSFNSSTPYFWMNLLTVFSCSISLGVSMSLHSLETGITGTAFGSVGAVLKSLNLATLVILSFLLGQILGSSGGVLFLAEFVVTSISFILGGAGTISASSLESWSCFFFLSSTAFWGYLFGRVALVDGIIRQKRFVRSNLFSTSLLCASLGVALFLWTVMFLWRWDVPVSLMILRPGMVKTARGASGASAAAGGSVARRAASDYAAKHLQ